MKRVVKVFSETELEKYLDSVVLEESGDNISTSYIENGNAILLGSVKKNPKYKNPLSAKQVMLDIVNQCKKMSISIRYVELSLNRDSLELKFILNDNIEIDGYIYNKIIGLSSKTGTTNIMDFNVGVFEILSKIHYYHPTLTKKFTISEIGNKHRYVDMYHVMRDFIFDYARLDSLMCQELKSIANFKLNLFENCDELFKTNNKNKQLVDTVTTNYRRQRFLLEYAKSSIEIQGALGKKKKLTEYRDAAQTHLMVNPITGIRFIMSYANMYESYDMGRIQKEIERVTNHVYKYGVAEKVKATV